MMTQTFVHEKWKADFDSRLASYLAGGWQVVPGTYRGGMVVLHYPATQYEKAKNETCGDYFVALECDDAEGGAE